jgi:hypothetical protein
MTTEDNGPSDYVGQRIQKMWKSFPGFLRKEFETNFTVGMTSKDKQTEAEQWLKIMRELRDCLVLVNGQFKFCDPETVNKILYIRAGSFLIPIWPQKALYWYHLDAPEETDERPLAGIGVSSGRCYLKNLSNEAWSLISENVKTDIMPQGTAELTEGTAIQLQNGKILRVVRGGMTVPENDPETDFITDHDEKDSDSAVQHEAEADSFQSDAMTDDEGALLSRDITLKSEADTEDPEEEKAGE